jgi:hypothetical protein
MLRNKPYSKNKTIFERKKIMFKSGLAYHVVFDDFLFSTTLFTMGASHNSFFAQMPKTQN